MTQEVTREFIDALGDLLTDFLGIVLAIESSATANNGDRREFKSIYSVKELRVMHMVFRYWRRGAPCTATAITGETGINKTTVSRAITSLIQNGLLQEKQDPEDGRRRLLVPTAAGEKTLSDVSTWLATWAEKLQEIASRGQTPLQSADGPAEGGRAAGGRAADGRVASTSSRSTSKR